MKKQVNKATHKRLIQTRAQAEMVFQQLLSLPVSENLENGIYQLLEKLDNPKMLSLFDQFPALVQEHGLEGFMNGKKGIRNASLQDTRTAGLLAMLELLVLFCKETFTKEIEVGTCANEESVKATIGYVMRILTIDDFVGRLYKLVIRVVGAPYYATFMERLVDLEGTTNPRDYNKLYVDPGVKEHVSVVLWLGSVRLFLEAVYFYYEPAK